MVKEYGKKNKPGKGSSLMRQLTLLSVAFLCGYLSAALFTFSDVQSWFSTHLLANKTQQVKSPTPAQAALPKPKFEFYTLLTKESSSSSTKAERRAAVTTPPASLPDAQKKAEVKTATPIKTIPEKPTTNTAKEASFLVQVASFKNKKDAERMKASLILKGFSTTLATVNRNNVIWYRVIIGPYDTRIQAEKAQVNVAKSENVMGMIRKMDG